MPNYIFIILAVLNAAFLVVNVIWLVRSSRKSKDANGSGVSQTVSYQARASDWEVVHQQSAINQADFYQEPAPI